MILIDHSCLKKESTVKSLIPQIMLIFADFIFC